MSIVRDAGHSQGEEGQRENELGHIVSGGGGHGLVRLKNVLDKDVDGLEAFLESLDSALATSERRLTESEDELVSHVQAENSLTFALTYRQFAQNLAISDQILVCMYSMERKEEGLEILAANGLDAGRDMLALNKLALSAKINGDSLINMFVLKAALTSTAESWEEFKKKRFSQLHSKDGESNVPAGTSSSINAHLLSKVISMGQRIIAFLQEEIEVLEQLFKEIGPILYLVHSLYHKFYTRQIRAALNLQFSSESYSRHSRSHSQSSNIQSSSASRNSNSHQPQQEVHSHSRSHSQPNSQHQESNQTTNSTLEWDEWAILCMEVKNSVSSFSKEVAKICGINSGTEFERHFPLIPVFHEASHSANDILTSKISRTFTSSLAVEREAFNQSRTYPSTHTPSSSNFRSYPLIADTSLLPQAKSVDLPLVSPPISASASITIEVLDNLVEFIASAEFRPLIETFVRAILPAMMTCTNRLALATRDVPQANDIEFLYISLNTAAALHERFVIYEHVLAPAHGSYFLSVPPSSSTSSPASPISPPVLLPSTLTPFSSLSPSSLPVPLRSPPSSSIPHSPRSSGVRTQASPTNSPISGFPLQYSPFNTPLIPSSLSILWECQRMLDVEVLRQSDQLISILVDSCCTHIFPNIDMNEWQDHRGFYSDSRPSHGIQMLHYFLQSHSRTLHAHLTPQCVQYVLAHTTRRCAELLLVRYASISPSRMRSTHFRLDITYLVAAIQTLQRACGAWYAKLCLPSLCCDLISLMAVVISPLDSLCSFLKHHVAHAKHHTTEQHVVHTTKHQTTEQHTMINNSNDLMAHSKQKMTFLHSPPRSLVTHPPALEGIIPNFHKELWSSEGQPRAEVRPIEDMQFLLDKHDILASYSYNFLAILENCSTEFSGSFLVQLVSHRPELKDNIYPPLTDADKELLPILQDFLRAP